ncbi:MAG: NUDIX domain-containing protein [Chloroflexi bacterium]|nr:NUDIX domain-containing protein [Chloroflexota bacterium]
MNDQIMDRPNTYTVIPRVVAFIEKGNEILMIERLKKNAFAYQKLNGIGGHIEKGEDPLSAIRREVFEECGLQIQDFDLCAIIFMDVETEKGVCVFVYSAQFQGGQITPSDEGHILWVERSNLSNYNIIKDVPLLLEVIAESKKDKRVKYLQYIYVEEELTIRQIP